MTGEDNVRSVYVKTDITQLCPKRSRFFAILRFIDKVVPCYEIDQRGKLDSSRWILAKTRDLSIYLPIRKNLAEKSVF